MRIKDLEPVIIQLMKSKNEKAMKPLFNHFHKGLFYFALQFVDDRTQAEDSVTDAFVKLWEKSGDFENLIAIRSFLYITVQNSCLNYLKHLHRRTASHKEILHLLEKDDAFVESKIIKADLMRVILEEVESLPRIRRNIFKMIFIEGLSVAEIARQLSISTDTVRVQKARALRGVRSALLKRGIRMDISTICATLYCLKTLQAHAMA